MTVHFEYKCRRCGVIENSTQLGTPDGDTFKAFYHLACAIQGIQTETMAPTLLSTHRCKDGGAGIADLIGHSAPA